MFNRPKSLTCYVCGREFGTKSLGIHIPQCIKKFEMNEMQKHPRERRKVPQPPKGLDNVIQKGVHGTLKDEDIKKFNEKQYDNFNENVLMPCPNCGRTFLDDRLIVHLRSCKPKEGGPRSGSIIKKVPLNQQKQEQKPLSLVCFICKKEFGTLSIKIHIPQCMRKQDREIEMPYQLEALLMKEHLTHRDVEDYNRQTLDQQRPKSGKCVTFSKQTNAQSSEEEQEEQEQEQVHKLYSTNGNLVPCVYCSRKFAQGRIDMHQKICRRAQEKEQKRLKKFGQKVKKEEQEENKKENKEKKTQKWRQQHESLVDTMKYMREVKKAEEEGQDVRKVAQPKSMTTVSDSLISCPHCNRKFNKNAADRHIPICKNIINKPAPVSKYNRFANTQDTQYYQQQQKLKGEEENRQAKESIRLKEEAKQSMQQRNNQQQRQQNQRIQSRSPIQQMNRQGIQQAKKQNNNEQINRRSVERSRGNDQMKELLQQRQFQPQLDRIAHLQKQEQRYRMTVQEEQQERESQHKRHVGQERQVVKQNQSVFSRESKGYQFQY